MQQTPPRSPLCRLERYHLSLWSAVLLTFFHPPLRYIYHESARPFPPSLWMMQSSRLSPRRCFLGLFLAWKAKPLHLSLILARGKSTSCEHHYVPPAEGPRAQWRSPALRAEGPSLPSAPQPSPTRPCRLAQHRRRCSKRWGATARQQICIPSISADVLFWTNACCNRVRQQRWERMPVPVGELPLHRSLQRHVVNEGPSCHAMRQQSTCVGQ